MITFLPSRTFTVCAKALDDQRLLAQVGEARIILEAILEGKQVGQPAFDMWRPYPGHLAIYGKIMSDERHVRWGTRTETFFIHHIPQWFYGLGRGGESEVEIRQEDWNRWDPAKTKDPPWLGDQRLHLSHIRALYHKNPTIYAKWHDITTRPATYCCVGCNYWWPTHAGVM
jgi:hypothetical protein